MESIELENNKTNKIAKYNLLVSLTEKIKDSTFGLKNLMTTYVKYHKIVSMLESIEQDIVDQLLRTMLIFIPDMYKPEPLLVLGFKNNQISVRKSNSPMFPACSL